MNWTSSLLSTPIASKKKCEERWKKKIKKNSFLERKKKKKKKEKNVNLKFILTNFGEVWALVRKLISTKRSKVLFFFPRPRLAGVWKGRKHLGGYGRKLKGTGAALSFRKVKFIHVILIGFCLSFFGNRKLRSQNRKKWKTKSKYNFKFLLKKLYNKRGIDKYNDR